MWLYISAIAIHCRMHLKECLTQFTGIGAHISTHLHKIVVHLLGLFTKKALPNITTGAILHLTITGYLWFKSIRFVHLLSIRNSCLQWDLLVNKIR